MADDGNTSVRFRPNLGLTGTADDVITFRAWDRTDGTAGTKADVSQNGWASAVSTATDTISVTMTSVYWDGGGDGTSWSDAANWSADTLPGPGDDVLIDAAGDVTIDHSNMNNTIRGLSCNESLEIPNYSLTVTGPAQVRGATLRCPTRRRSPPAAPEPDSRPGVQPRWTGRPSALGGAVLSLPSLTSYSEDSGLADIVRTLEAVGTGSVLDLPSLVTLSGTSTNEAYVRIEASAGGQINMSSVTTIETLDSVYGFLERGIVVSADGADSVVDLSTLTDFLDDSPHPGFLDSSRQAAARCWPTTSPRRWD